jgi:hypothetical protein
MKVIYVAALLMLGLPFAGVCDEPASGNKKDEAIIRFEDTKVLSMEEFEKLCAGKEMTLVERFEKAYNFDALMQRSMQCFANLQKSEIEKKKRTSRKYDPWLQNKGKTKDYLVRTFGDKPVLGVPAWLFVYLSAVVFCLILYSVFLACSCNRSPSGASDCKKVDTK